MRRSTSRAALALCLAAAFGSASCSIGDKSARAERIQRSVAALATVDTIAEISYELALDAPQIAASARRSPSTTNSQLGQFLAARASVTTRAELEPGARRATVTVGDEAAPSAVFDDTEIFVKRRNARPTERRTWARLDLADLRFDRGIGIDDLAAPALSRATAIAINPVYFVELVVGALAGSVKVVGTPKVDGVHTTQYRFNLSFDKAITDLDFGDDARATRLGVFRQLGIRKDVVSAAAWLDTDGGLRRMRIEVPVELGPLERHDLTVTVDLAPAPNDVFVTPPSPETAVTYSALGRLVRAGLPEEA